MLLIHRLTEIGGWKMSDEEKKDKEKKEEELDEEDEEAIKERLKSLGYLS